VSPSLLEHCTLKAYEAVQVQMHQFVTSALERGECTASQLGPFTTSGRCPWCPLDRTVGRLHSFSPF